MSKITYFQRYDTKENWLTNSTLLLLSRLYFHNRAKYEKVLNSILEDSNLSLNIGVQFGQQEKGKHSVVDGVISQDSFKVVIETKLADNFTSDQLKRHLSTLSSTSGKKILLALSKNKVQHSIRKEVIEALKNEEYKGVEFASTTYQTIIQTIQENLAEFEIDMKIILDDYISLCEEHGLVDIENNTLLAFSANTSFEDNLNFSIYYDPVNRTNNLPFKYIGLYRDKAIRAIGKFEKLVYCDLVGGQLVPTNGTALNLTTDEYDRIKNIIEHTSYYNLRSGNKFFLVDKFYNTKFVKTSFSSLRLKRYFFLEQIESFDNDANTEKIAKWLNGKTWE